MVKFYIFRIFTKCFFLFTIRIQTHFLYNVQFNLNRHQPSFNDPYPTNLSKAFFVIFVMCILPPKKKLSSGIVVTMLVNYFNKIDEIEFYF